MTFEEFKNKYEHKPIGIHPSKTQNDVLVSVCVVTYNQVSFIRQCLDNILNQKTNFSFEILLGDDASKDGTREICLDYANKYPDKIRLFLHHRENNIKIAGRPTGRFNFLYNLYAAQGKYIAFCEGDDFWIDPNKLQKQVDFLEKNQDYILTHSDADIYVENTKRTYGNINKVKGRNIASGDVFTEKLESKYRIFTCTTLFRNFDDLISSTNGLVEFAQADLILFLELAHRGKFKYFEESMATYRVNQGSVTRSGSLLNKALFKESSVNVRLDVGQKYNVDTKIIERLYIDLYKVRLEIAYLKKDKDLMETTLRFLSERGVLLDRQQQFKSSIVLSKGIGPIIKKIILDMTDTKSKLVGKLSDYKNKYIIR